MLPTGRVGHHCVLARSGVAAADTGKSSQIRDVPHAEVHAPLASWNRLIQDMQVNAARGSQIRQWAGQAAHSTAVSTWAGRSSNTTCRRSFTCRESTSGSWRRRSCRASRRTRWDCRSFGSWPSSRSRAPRGLSGARCGHGTRRQGPTSGNALLPSQRCREEERVWPECECDPNS